MIRIFIKIKGSANKKVFSCVKAKVKRDLFPICEDDVPAFFWYVIYRGLNQWVVRNQRIGGFMFFRLWLMDTFRSWFPLNDDSIKIIKFLSLKFSPKKIDSFVDLLQIHDSSWGYLIVIVSTHYAHNTKKIDGYSDLDHRIIIRFFPPPSLDQKWIKVFRPNL